MGVKDLWSILAPVKKEVPLTELIGKTIAVDLSVWICENNGLKAVQGRVCKPHLRALFFRVSNLLQMGVNLVFVVDGEPPELKWETISSRVNARFGGRGRRGGGNPKQRTSRSHFKSLIKESLELLDYLGVPYVQSKGEAEAMCALLNERGIVDACITEDGDVFLYGGQTIYRNFNLTGKNPVIERYSMSDVTEQLGMSRNTLVALALLLGCDYIPKGVPGVGKVHAVQLVQQLAGQDILKRFQNWSKETSSNDSLPAKPAHCSRCHHVGSTQLHRSTGCPQCIGTTTCSSGKDLPLCTCKWHRAKKEYDVCSVERDIRAKAMKIPNFPQLDVISEFLNVKDVCPKQRLKKSRPEMVKLMRFAHEKLEWAHVYTREKVVHLVTLYNLERSFREELRLDHIVKRRVRNGVACLEVAWKLPGLWRLEEDDSTTISTIEKVDLFKSVHREIFAEFECKENLKKGKKKGDKKKKPTKDMEVEESLEVVTEQLKKVDLHSDMTCSKDLCNPEGSSLPSDTASRLMNKDFESSKSYQEQNDSDASCGGDSDDDTSIQSEVSKNLNERRAVSSDERPNESVYTCKDHLHIPSLRERLQLRTKHKLQQDCQTPISSSTNGFVPARCGVSGGIVRDCTNNGVCYSGPIELDPSCDTSNSFRESAPSRFESLRRVESLENAVVSENISDSTDEVSTLEGNAHDRLLHSEEEKSCNLQGFETVTEPQDVPTPDVSLINNVSTDDNIGKSVKVPTPSLDKGWVIASSLLKRSGTPDSSSFHGSSHQLSELLEPTEVYDLCTPDVTLEFDKSQSQQFNDVIVVVSDDEDELLSHHQTSTEVAMIVPKDTHTSLNKTETHLEVAITQGTVYSQLNENQTIMPSMPCNENMKKARSVSDHLGQTEGCLHKLENIPCRVTTPECSMWLEPTLLDVSTPFQRHVLESQSTYSHQPGSTESNLIVESSSDDIKTNSARDSIQRPCLDNLNRSSTCGTPFSGITVCQELNHLKHSYTSSPSLDFATARSDCEADKSRDHSLFQGLNFSLKTSPWNCWTPPLDKSRHEMRCESSAWKENNGPRIVGQEMKTSQGESKNVLPVSLLQGAEYPKVHSHKDAKFHRPDFNDPVAHDHSRTGDSQSAGLEPQQNVQGTNPVRFQNHDLHSQGEERVVDCGKAVSSHRCGQEGMIRKQLPYNERSLCNACVAGPGEIVGFISNKNTEQESANRVEELSCGEQCVSSESKLDTLEVERKLGSEDVFRMEGCGMSSGQTDNITKDAQSSRICKEGLSCYDKSNVIGQRKNPTVASTTDDHRVSKQRPLNRQLSRQRGDVYMEIHMQKKMLLAEEKENSPASLMDRLRKRNVKHRDILKSMELD